MLSRTVRWNSILALVAAMVAVTAANGQEERRVQKETEAQPASQAYRAKSVLGSKVSIEGNVAVGTVDDIVFADDGYLEYLIVLNDNKLVTVPWEAAKFNFEKRTAVVNIAPERFKVIPTYTVDQYPVFSTPRYRVETYKYYGLTPAQERRAIRRAVVVP
ncbi:MAG: PRC-barrel domain-containing protein [Planctomycetota bacterium]